MKKFKPEEVIGKPYKRGMLPYGGAVTKGKISFVVSEEEYRETMKRLEDVYGGLKDVYMIVEKGDYNYSAYCPDIPGVIATGSTKDETIKNMKEAIIGMVH